MGGGKEKQKTNAMLDQQNQQVSQEHSTGTVANQQDTAKDESNQDQSRGDTQGAISNVASRDYSSNYNPDTNFTPNQGESNTAYRGFLDNGGIDENAMRVAHPMFQEQMYDPTIASNFRANGTYDEFNRTGGYSEADKGNIRSRANSIIPATYANIRAEGDRQAVAQGGYNPGGMALKARMAREQAGAMADTARDTEIGINDKVNAGRQWGAQGMTGAEGAYQGERLGAGTALDRSEANIQGTLQQGRMFGASGIAGNESQANNIGFQQADNNANRGMTQATGNANRALSQDQSVVGANQNILQGDNSLVQADRQGALAERGLTYDAQGNIIQNRNSMKPGINWGKVASGAAGVGAGLLSAYGDRND